MEIFHERLKMAVLVVSPKMLILRRARANYEGSQNSHLLAQGSTLTAARWLLTGYSERVMGPA